MSSPGTHPVSAPAHDLNDDPMDGSLPEEEVELEGEGDAMEDDSSEEEDDNPEELKKISQGFIVDEDEEEEGEDEDDEEEKREKRQRKKHAKRKRRRDEDLEEDDLELLEENTGASFRRRPLKRLTRRRSSHSPVTSPSQPRKVVIDSSDDDLDNDEDLPQVQDIQRIWDSRDDDEDGDMDDMDNFIDYDDEEGAEAMDEKEREERRKERRRLETERRKAMLGRPELVGIDANAWDEIHGVFGDGHEYDWALARDDEPDLEEEHSKPEMRYQDVFEPSEIRDRMLTDDDDLIRAQDVPERMQLANSSLSKTSSLSLHKSMQEADVDEAAQWVAPRISAKKYREYFHPDGARAQLQEHLVLAASNAIKLMFVEEFEVPYIWTHKRDHISYFEVKDIRTRIELLSLSDTWRVYSLGQQYRSLDDRRKLLEASYARLGVKDEYYELHLRPKMTDAEVVADTTEWLTMKYKDKKKDNFEIHFHDDEEQPETRKRKMPTRVSAYEVAKKSIISKLAKGYGIQPHDVVLNFIAQHQTQFIEDQELNPVAYAEQFADPNLAKALPPETLLSRARMILSTELGKDPLLRQAIRDMFKEHAQISVLPTEKGLNKIDEHHLYFNFKYLHHKNVREMLETPQFLNILAAEAEHLITVSIFLPPDAQATFEGRLIDAFSSDSFSDNVKAWNEERASVVRETLDSHLIPLGAKWVREWLREEVENYLAIRCAELLRDRVDLAPYITPHMRPGDTSSVLALSWGKGDPQVDDISVVFLDEAGRLREHTKLDNLVDPELQDEFTDILKRRKPDVIVIGGFSMATAKLSQRVKLILGGGNSGLLTDGFAIRQQNKQSFNIPVIYVDDEVARIYQHSKRAAEELSALSLTTKYCVGLARYTQNPLSEYAALGVDLTAIAFDEDDQHLVPREKLLSAFEQVLVDVVNKVGVDINRAVTDSYYQHLLPFVCGLGPRKAQVLIKKIGTMGGTLINREQFIKNGLLTTKIFLNASGFLRIPHDTELKPVKGQRDEDVQDPLDDTRIHPEDYELARKMATDALELDEEDIHDEHPSHVVSLIMKDPENEKKLNDLNLDEFAINLFETNEERKRHTLHVIQEELMRPFAEQRSPFPPLKPWEVLTMLSSETPRTLRDGLIVTGMVIRIQKTGVEVRLDSGIEAFITLNVLADPQPASPHDVVKKGQTITGVVYGVKLDLEQDLFTVNLCTRPADIARGDNDFRKVQHDDAWNQTKHDRDSELQARKKRAEVDKTRRVIKHPNFHNFNSPQAEAYLETQQRGDVVIRPSSKGIDHLAVTWKVHDGLYQHIDVSELDADPTGQTVGGQLIVDRTHTYSDLDDLIVNHVQAVARRVEELMDHEKFKQGSEDELHLFLKNFVAANPAKSAYGFTLNRKKPGHFNLCFLASKGSVVQTWPVRVAPEAYYLFDAPAVGVPELCDAFKVRHLHESQNIGAASGGKTPYGAGGRTPARTPARTPGHATPGHMSVRHLGRTPNPYGPPAGPVPTAVYASGPPAFGAPQVPAPYGGFQAPGYPPQPPGLPPHAPGAPPNPDRAAMLQSWQGGGGW